MAGIMSLTVVTSCSDDDNNAADLGSLTPADNNFGKANDVFTAEEWYPGGELGTTEKASYSAAAPAVERIAGMEEDFNTGEDFFEHLYTIDQAPRKGLGPAWVRNGCIACHPSYGHGKRQTEYKASTIGNGYLLVVYHPNEAFTEDGVRYTVAPSSYIAEVTGMPQTQAMTPFKAPIDERQITINWPSVDRMPSGIPMQFKDGETYDLIYPVIEIPQTAFNTNPKPTNYEVRLESTIGVYGTGLIDAISDDDMREQYRREAPYVDLNPAMWDKEANDFAASAYYTASYNDTRQHNNGKGIVKKFTYAMTRGSLQDGAGANAIWNITNVTRSDRRYHYLDLNGKIYATYASKDPEVQAGFPDYIRQVTTAEEHPEFFTANVEENIFNYLTSKNLPAEMSDDDYIAFAVWHRGLAVPAARNIEDDDIQEGRRLFTQIGCAQCHRPSWTTGDDEVYDPNFFTVQDAKSPYFGKTLASLMPRYPKQTIWPYTDMVQHKLYMKNDLRTGWCRTTPLWGRGLHQTCSGSPYADRLHDCRARNVVEAIMWHAANEGGTSDATRAVEGFRNLSKEERQKVVDFINAI